MEFEAQQLPVIVLAAGEGHRLQAASGGQPKPLARVLGLSLLERAILSCAQAGFRKFFVVVGHRASEVASHVADIRERRALSITVVENPHWEKGNGTSVSACSSHISSHFVVVMCDHLFDPEILWTLLEEGSECHGCYLAVDSDKSGVFDIEDATCVRLEDARIVAIDKSLEAFDAIDTGLFLCHPSIFDALKKAWEAGDGSLTAGVRELAAIGKAHTTDVTGSFWLDVDTPQALIQARQSLLAWLGKRAGGGYVARLINRRLSRPISALLASTRITPNAVSILSFLIALSGAFAFAAGAYAWALAGGFAIQLASIVDGCDGEIASLKFQATRFGAWFDTMLDRYADAAIAIGITYGYWVMHRSALVWVLGAIALLGLVLASYMHKEYAIRYGEHLNGSVMRNLIKRDTRIFLLFLGALANWQFWALMVIGFFSHAAIVWFFVRQRVLREPERFQAR